MKKSLLALILVAATSLNVVAAESSNFFDGAFSLENANPALIAGGWSSHHVGDDGYDWEGERYQYTEDNKAVGFEFYNVSVVKFTNSYNKAGTALFYTIEPDWASTKYVDFGLRVGATLGYGDTPVNMPVAPYVAPVAELKPFADIDYVSGLHFEIAAQPIPGEGVVMMLNGKFAF